MAAVLENYEIWLKEAKRDAADFAHRSSILFDTVAIYLAFSEQALEMEELRLVVTDEGKTVESEEGKAIRVATEWRDLDGFYDLLVERLLAAP